MESLKTTESTFPFAWKSYTEDQKKMIHELIWVGDYKKDENRDLYHAMHLCWAVINVYIILTINNPVAHIAIEYKNHIFIEDYEVPDETGGFSMWHYYTCLDLGKVTAKMLEWEGKDIKDYPFFQNL